MKNLGVLVLVFACVSVPFAKAPPSHASVPESCVYAKYHPGLSLMCAWEMMMDFWNPLDWGDDGDADDLGG